MAYPSKVTVGFVDSVKTGDYQYRKPSIEVEVTLNPGDNFQEAVTKANKSISEEIKKWRQELGAK